MRILVMTPWLGFWELGVRGGVPDEYLTFQGLVRRGHDVHVVAPAGAHYELPGEGPGALALHPVPYPALRIRGRIKGQLARLRDLIAARWAYGHHGGAIAATIRPDVILAHTFHTAPWASAVGSRLGVPVVSKFFGVLGLNTGWGSRLGHFIRHFEHYLSFRRPFARVIVLDDGSGGDQAAERLGVPADRLLSWPNGVDVQWADLALPPGGGNREARERLGLAPDVIYTLTVSRAEKWKRVDRVLSALAVLQRQGDEKVHALIAGAGATRGSLEAQARSLGLTGRVEFLGPIDHDRVPEVMTAADIYVAPHDLTNAGLPTCEAMLCRLPVVAMDSGTTSKLVANERSGLVVPNGDVEALAGAIRRLAHDPEARRRMGSAGHQLARERFVSWEERVRMEVELLEALAKGGEPGGGRQNR